MKYTILAFSPLCCFIPTIAHTQPIIPNQDGTGTIVNQQGNQFNIQGGSRSSNNTNLFHSFQEFNLHQGQIANFISAPNIENILGRINGGNPSIIHGLIQVTGGNSNLFLMNPAGIIFGANASLNLPASFHFSTATGFGFGDNQWFQSIGNSDYQNLVGTPNKFVFSHHQPGTIINQGNLSLTTGQSLSLLGGGVINTGELSVPGGNITMAAVPGENIVKISQAGHLLSLELLPLINSQLPTIQAVSLPQLLTGNGSKNQANTIKINEFGQVVLGNTGFGINDINQTAINTGKIDVSQPNNGSGGQVNIIGKKVGLINGEINASGYNQGGTVLIGGDWQGQGIIPNALQTYVDQDSLINADAIHNGNAGKVIIWSDDQTTFQGSITARGGINSGNGGLVEISGKKQLIFDGKVNVSAVHGLPGTVLFDPDNLTLEKSNSENNSATNSQGNITDDPDSQSSEFVSQSEATNVTKSEQSENTDKVTVKKETTTDNKDSSESMVTENEKLSVEQAVIDPFQPDESNNVTVNSENVNKLDVDKLDVSGNIELQADNDLTVNQAITTDKSLKLVAGRSINININADIDTSKGNGDIGIFANNSEVDQTKRQTGPANILQAENTELNAGTGNIIVEMGTLGEVGEIKLGNLTTKGLIAIQGAGANIHQVSANSLFRADKIILETSDSGGIGKSDLPLRIDVHNLEAETGSGGLFLRAIAPLTIGNVSDSLSGISTNNGGEINLKVDGDLTVPEDIISYLYGEPDNIQMGGNVSINATGNIQTGDIYIQAINGDVGNIKIESKQGFINTSSGNIDISSNDSIGNVFIIALNDIIIGHTFIYSGGDIGTINIESKQGLIDTRPLVRPTPKLNEYISNDQNTDDINTRSTEGIIDYYGNIVLYSQIDIGNFSIMANDDIKIGDIYINSGNIGDVNIESKQNVIDISSGLIGIYAQNVKDVDININVVDKYREHIHIDIYAPVAVSVNQTGSYAVEIVTSVEDKLPDNDLGNTINIEPITTVDGIINIEKNNSNLINNIEKKLNNDVGNRPINIDPMTPFSPTNINGINLPNTNINPMPQVTQVISPLINTPQPNAVTNIQPAINNIATSANLNRGTINQNPVSISRGSINTIPNNSNIQTQPPVLSPVFNIPQEQTNLNPITIPQSPINPIPQVGNNLPPNQNIKINNPSPVTINPNTITDPSNINTAIPRSENPNIVLTPTNLSQLNQENNLLNDQLGQSSETLTTNNPIKIGSNFQSLEEENIQIILNNLEQETGTKATLIAINSYLDSVQIVLYTANSQPVLKTIPVSRQQLLQLADNFRNINQLSQNISTNYLTEAQRLYQLLIQPIEDILQTNQTNTLLFSLDKELGNFPIADLYDGQKFLAEKYRIIPYGIR